MKIKRKTVSNVILIVLILSFFITPLGDFSKELLNKWFASVPTIIGSQNQGKIADYNWKLKDAEWNYFNFEEAKNHVVFINFWASWNLPSRAQLDDIQELYELYKGKVKFYIITDEEKEDPEEIMAQRGYSFPITYQIIGESSPIRLLKPPGTYILDKKGNIVVHQNDIANWNNQKIYQLLDDLIKEQ